MTKQLPMILVVLIILSGCSLFSNSTTAVLWTNKPELAAYGELFNAENEARKVEVVYKEYPWVALEQESNHPDLVAGTRLDSLLVLRHFSSVDNLIKNELILPSRFYQPLYEMGRRDTRQLLLPISFSLPMIVFKSELNSALSNDYLITVEEMRNLSSDFNTVDGRPIRMGYSPRWQPEFVYSLALLLGADFAESEARLPVWNDARLQQAIELAIDWVNTTNGGDELESSFALKYMYDPLYKLLDTGRILFVFMETNRFLSLPTEVRENLDIRWLSDGSRIAVGEDVLYIGKTKQAKRRKTADAFISWLFQPSTQARLLETAQFERMRSIGIAGGLSSIPSVNTDSLTRYFDFLHGHIPDRDTLVFPNRLPESWEEIRAEVITPWISDAMSLEELEPLSERLRQWRLQQPEYLR